MKNIYSFEFMDVEFIPASIRHTLRDLLRLCNDLPFRPYNRWVARKVLRRIKEDKFDHIIELGAGTAPISRLLVKEKDLKKAKLIPTDLLPDEALFKSLKIIHGQKIEPRFDSCDFSRPLALPRNSILVLNATFHHLPFGERAQVLKSLSESGDYIIVCEALRSTLPSLMFCLLSPFSSLVAPLYLLGTPGNLRRIIWCWVLPIAPLMFVWDGWVSSIRVWSKKTWQTELDKLGYQPDIEETLFAQSVSWSTKRL